MSKRTAIAPKNAKALTQLRSWFEAVGIQCRPSKAGNDLTVVKADGSEVELKVVMGAPRPSQDVIVVAGKTLTGRKISDALSAFQSVQKRLGYEAKNPVNRGTPPSKKALYTDDFEGVAFRHTETHRSPNPNPAAWKRYDAVINRATWAFYNNNLRLCRDHQHDFDDLKQHSMMWTVNFLGLHKLPEEKDKNSDNEKLLTVYLHQRFSNFRDILYLKGRNIFPSLDTASIAQSDRPYDYSSIDSWTTAKPVEEEDDEIIVDDSDEEIKPMGLQARKEMARDQLDEALASLSHDQRIAALSEAAQNNRINPDAQKLAIRMLKEHVQACADCKDVKVPSAEEEDDVPGSEPGSDAE